jgi:DNA-directed RNA polymerase specialized sigma24 family protein
MMALPESLMPTLGPVLDSVAAQMSRRYWSFGGTHEELVQEGWLWAAEHPEKLLLWFDDELTDPKAGEKMLAKSLRNHLQGYGESLKAQALGYSTDDLTYYSRQYVRELLPLMFDDEAWMHPEQGDGERRAPSDPAAGGNWVATLADLSRAFAKLDVNDRDLLTRFHRDDVSNNAMADRCGVSKQTMSDWHDKAIRRLVDLLGGPRPRSSHDAECQHPYVGSRHAISNAQARAYQQSMYEED